ncbi:MAG: hypothetical protein J5969_05665 [Lachnospiraceae bacterium]|nr:hypothetical protein [Lachnospiraceae bacterium]
MPYEMTQVRLHLKKYLAEINDVLTKQEDIRHYEELTTRLDNLRGFTDALYNNLDLKLTEELYGSLRENYKRALEAIDDLMAEDGIGPAGMQLRAIARELRPLLMADLNALDILRHDNEFSELTIGEAMGRARTQAADLGDQPLPEGDAFPIRMQGADSIQNGIFRPSVPGQQNDHAAACSRLTGILGKPETVTRAVPTLLMHKGGIQAGTFVSRANGLDPIKVDVGDPFLGFTNENLDTGAGTAGLSAMQLIDYLCGSKPRGPENVSLRFDIPYATGDQVPKLTGLTARSEGVHFTAEEPDPQRIGSLGIIPASMYTFLTSKDFAEKMSVAFIGLDIPMEVRQSILKRRDALIEKVEADKAFFEDKEVGFVEKGRVRVVPDAQMSQYKIENLAAIQGKGLFSEFLDLPKNVTKRVQEKQQRQKEAGVQTPGLLPTAKVIGNGLRQEPDPLYAERPETIKLRIGRLEDRLDAKNGRTQRYALKFKQGGKERKGFFSLPEYSSSGRYVRDAITSRLEDPANAKYRDVLLAMQDYYSAPDTSGKSVIIPGNPENLPWDEMGITHARAEKLKNDPGFFSLLDPLAKEITKRNIRINNDQMLGTSAGQRIELRNVAMSDIADELGVPNLLARSTTAKIEIGGKVVEGVFMETAEGVDARKANPGTALASITAEQIPQVYNTKGLKDLADMQILDYICMNRDRHKTNMSYKFEGLGTDHPKFLGIQGFDNDFAFGTVVPGEKERMGHLPALTDIKVISVSMSLRLREPGLMDRIAEKMRKNGLTEQEVEAARKRFMMITERLRKNKMTVVGDNEWGTGRYTLENLASGENNTSTFTKLKEMAEMMGRRAAHHPVEQGKYLPIEEPQYQDAQHVKEFGVNAMDAAVSAEAERHAEGEFDSLIREAMNAKTEVTNPEHAEILKICQTAATMERALDAGSLPWPWGSSEYREMHKACRNLRAIADRLADRIRRDPNLEISVEDSQDLYDHMTQLTDLSAAYADYKMGGGGKTGESTSRRREAAESCRTGANLLRTSYQSGRNQLRKPMHLVHEEMHKTQAGLSGKEDDDLRRQAARVLYLSGLTKVENEQKRGMGVYHALDGNVIAQHADRLMQDPAFKKLAALPDAELRALAAGTAGRSLSIRFFREKAKIATAPGSEYRNRQRQRHHQLGQGPVQNGPM